MVVLFLVIGCLLRLSEGILIKDTIWKKVSIPVDELSAASFKEERTARDTLHCFTLATDLGWPNLVCFDGVNCNLYNMNVNVNNANFITDVISCMFDLNVAVVDSGDTPPIEHSNPNGENPNPAAPTTPDPNNNGENPNPDAPTTPDPNNNSENPKPATTTTPDPNKNGENPNPSATKAPEPETTSCTLNDGTTLASGESLKTCSAMFYCSAGTLQTEHHVKTYASTCVTGFYSRPGIGCINRIQTESTWCEAREACGNHGSDLISIESAATFDALKQIIIDWTDDYWIGLHRPGQTWDWAIAKDGQLTEDMQKNWMEEPPEAGWQCAMLKYQDGEYYLKRSDCETSKLHFICEIPLDSTDSRQ